MSDLLILRVLPSGPPPWPGARHQRRPPVDLEAAGIGVEACGVDLWARDDDPPCPGNPPCPTRPCSARNSRRRRRTRRRRTSRRGENHADAIDGLEAFDGLEARGAVHVFVWSPVNSVSSSCLGTWKCAARTIRPEVTFLDVHSCAMQSPYFAGFHGDCSL